MFSSSQLAGTAAQMDRLYRGYRDDGEVDTLLSQLNDEALLKFKVKTHSTFSNRASQYPIFSDGWLTADDNAALTSLDTQLTSRFSSLKQRSVTSAKTTRGKEFLPAGKKGSNFETAVGKTGRESQAVGSNGSASKVVGKKGKEEEVSARSSKLFSEMVDGSNSRKPQNRELPKIPSPRPKSLYLRSSDDAIAAGDDEEDPDSIDALLKERFLALKAPRRSAPVPSSRNAGMDSLLQFSGQLASNDYEGYGSSLSTRSSPSSANLQRSKTGFSPRVLTTSVVNSCHCSAPSPLNLLKSVRSKSFPSKKQPQQQPSRAIRPPLPPASRSRSRSRSRADSFVTTPLKKAGREHKVEFQNSKPVGKESAKNENKTKTGKKSSNEGNNNNPSTVQEMRRLLTSVADRVGFEKNRVSSAEENDFLGEGLPSSWSLRDQEDEFIRARTEERKLNREAVRVVRWAKDVARLGPGESDVDSKAGGHLLGPGHDGLFVSKKFSKKPLSNGFEETPKNKKWDRY